MFFSFKFMKYLKPFYFFEGIIMPLKIEDDEIVNSFESAVQFGIRNGFDVVKYDEFYKSLDDADKKTAPPPHIPFFGLFHPKRKRPMFVICDERVVFRAMGHRIKEIISDIIGHERIHDEQSKRGSIKFILPDPLERKKYFSDKEEVMAFSFTIANDLSKTTNDIDSAMNKLKSGFSESSMIWREIKKYCDDITLNRYKKYIYLYLEEIFKKK